MTELGDIVSLFKCLICGSTFVELIAKEVPIADLKHLQASVIHGGAPDWLDVSATDDDRTSLRLLPCPTCVEISTRLPYEKTILQAEANASQLSQTLGIASGQGEAILGHPVSGGLAEPFDRLDMPLFLCKPISANLPLYQVKDDTKFELKIGSGPEHFEIDSSHSSQFRVQHNSIDSWLKEHEESVSKLIKFAIRSEGHFEKACEEAGVPPDTVMEISDYLKRLGSNELCLEPYSPSSGQAARLWNSTILDAAANFFYQHPTNDPLLGRGEVNLDEFKKRVKLLASLLSVKK